jgi:GNAT superfamily N-acetyltransferase
MMSTDETIARRETATRQIEFVPLTAERWDDFEALLGESGGDDGCWCMWWRLPRGEWTRQRGEGNRLAFKSIVESGNIPGIIAYVDGEPAGWCSVAPREAFASLNLSPTLKRVDDEPVWSIVCFYVGPSFRGIGLMASLLAAARDYAVSQGARIVEAYPREPEGLSTPMAYMGVVPAFEKAGFVEVLRRSPRQPIMRWQS